jgi:hypothetical protein
MWALLIFTLHKEFRKVLKIEGHESETNWCEKL